MPYQKAQYSLMTGTLSDVGYDIFWVQLNDLMRKLDLNINDVKVTQCTISTTYTQPALGNPESIYQYQIGNPRATDNHNLMN